MVVPLPAWVSEPVPVMALAAVSTPVRLKIRAPLLVIGPVPIVPPDPPAPTCSVPALIVVAPE
jgi:hypothetical protein